MKFVTFASAAPDETAEAFQHWFVHSYIPELMTLPSLRGGLVRRRVDPPAEVLLSNALDGPATIASPDVVLETWLPSSDDFIREIVPGDEELRRHAARWASYGVTAQLQKDPRVAEAGSSGRRPQLTLITQLRWATGVAAVDAERARERHSVTALRVQPRLTKYEQNVVRELISSSPGMPTVDAYADFSFATVHDCRDGFVITDEERREVAAFVGAATRSFFGDAEPLTRELLGGPAAASPVCEGGP